MMDLAICTIQRNRSPWLKEWITFHRLVGFTPLVSTWLIETTGDKASLGYWMAMAGGMGLIATGLIYRGIVKVRD